MIPVHHIEITQKSIIHTLLIGLGLYLLYRVVDIIVFIFIGFLIVVALNPIITKLESKGVRRALGLALTYLSFLALLVVTLIIIVPPLISQTISLINQIPLPPDLASNFSHLNLNLQDIQLLVNQLNSLPKIFSVISTAFSSIIVFVSLIVFSFYLLVERPELNHHLKTFLNPTQHQQVMNFVNQAEIRIGGWVRAEGILMTAVGTMTYVGLSLMGIRFALPLAILAGTLEILPNVGPTIAAIPAIAVAYFTGSPMLALAVTILTIVIQQVENNFIVPKVMQSTVGLSPVITIILLLIGFRLGNLAGAALAIPIFLVIQVALSQRNPNQTTP